MEQNGTMRGMELSRAYYEEVARDRIAAYCPEAVMRAAVGLAGEGSECFGFDDAVSRDHDFGPRLCIWLTDEDEMHYGEQLRAAYDALPGEFRGIRMQYNAPEAKSRSGVIRIHEFYRRYTGCPEGPETLRQWLAVPEHLLAAATNGAVFCDPVGIFTRIRERLLAFYPEDVRRKKLAAQTAKMAQAGQYNYPRCIAHREAVAAELALREFALAAMAVVYLLERRYMPFYKWAHRGLVPARPGEGPHRDVNDSRDSETGRASHQLACTVQQQLGQLFRSNADARTDRIESVCSAVRRTLAEQGLGGSASEFLLEHAKAIQETIRDPELRAMHLMVG